MFAAEMVSLDHVENAEHRVAFFRAQLHGWMDELFGSPDAEDLRKCFGKTLLIRNYILSPLMSEEETALYLADETTRDYIRRYQELSVSNEIRFERQMSKVLQAGTGGEGLMQIIRDYYAELYRLLARTEVFLSGMNRDSTVCMVGSGGMPLSVLFMHRFTGARVIGLDISEESLQDGTSFCDFLIGQYPHNFQRDAIDLRLADGATFDYRECNIIVLSIHITNKVEIIERIIETAPRDRDVVVIERQVKGLGQYFYRNYGFDPDGLPLTKVGSMSSSLLVSTAYRLER